MTNLEDQFCSMCVRSTIGFLSVWKSGVDLVFWDTTLVIGVAPSAVLLPHGELKEARAGNK